MIGRRAAIAFSMLSTLALCAFSASNAVALKGTTVFTCAQGGTQFSDAHCNTAGMGFGHVESAVGATTETSGTNEKTASATAAATNASLHFTIAGTGGTITCTKVSSTGSVATKVNGSGQMEATGNATVNYTGCTTTIKNCTVSEPIIAEVNGSTQVNAADEMWTEFQGAKAGGVIANITFTGPKCIFQPPNNSFPVTGTAIGTPKGATLEFIKGEPKSTLKFAANSATFSAVETVSRKGGSPLTLTTTAS
jgi:hypothetical protein